MKKDIINHLIFKDKKSEENQKNLKLIQLLQKIMRYIWDQIEKDMNLLIK